MSFSNIGTKSGKISHYCNVQSGEGIEYYDRQNIRIDIDADDNENLYSGRVFYRANTGLGILGLPDVAIDGPGTITSQLFIAPRGVDHPDINPWALPGTDGLLSAPAMGPTGRGTINAIPLVEGLKVDTTEFVDDAGDYNIGDRVYITEDGEWTIADPGNDGFAVGFVTSGQPADEVAASADAVYRLWELNIISVDIAQIDFS